MNEKALDYIQASVTISEQDIVDMNCQQIPPLKFYKRGYRHSSGIRYFFGNPNSAKALIVLSGLTLDEVRNTGKTDNEIISDLFGMNASFTRIDYALTQYDDENMIFLSDMQRYFADGLIKSPLIKRGAKLVSSLDKDGELLPETFYIGDLKKRGDKGIFRSYDKGLQLDISRFLMIRHEFEERGDNCQNSAKRIADGASVSSVMNSRFSVNADKWKIAMDAPSISIERGKAKESELSPNEKRWKWLIETVAPTLEKALREDKVPIEDNENFAHFCANAGLSERIRMLALHLSGIK